MTKTYFSIVGFYFTDRSLYDTASERLWIRLRIAFGKCANASFASSLLQKPCSGVRAALLGRPRNWTDLPLDPHLFLPKVIFPIRLGFTLLLEENPESFPRQCMALKIPLSVLSDSTLFRKVFPIDPLASAERLCNFYLK